MNERNLKYFKMIALVYVMFINPILLRIVEDSDLQGCCYILAIIFGVVLMIEKKDLNERKRK